MPSAGGGPARSFPRAYILLGFKPIPSRGAENGMIFASWRRPSQPGPQSRVSSLYDRPAGTRGGGPAASPGFLARMGRALWASARVLSASRNRAAARLLVWRPKVREQILCDDPFADQWEDLP